ncbi:MAG: SNF2-related protein [Lachnospiraceae bacterium]
MSKTVSTLTAINDLMYDYFTIAKVLVIAPKRVAEDTWSTEVEKWDHLTHLTISKVLGSASDRKAALRATADIYVINRENVRWLVEYLGKAWNFDMLVIDELSSFKSNKSQRFKYLKRVLPLVDRVVGLTGTPAPNGLMDLWPQIYLLDQGKRLGKNITAYRSRFFYPSKMNGHIVYAYEPKEGADGAIHRLIEDITVSMKAADYLELPEKIMNDIYITLDPKVMKKYRQLEREQILQLDGDTITALQAASVYNKLLQLANGSVYDDEKSVISLHDEKVEALKGIIEEAQGHPVLVFYNFKHDYRKLIKTFPKARTLNGSADIKEWNAGKIDLLLAQPASMGHGLNIQAGGHIIVWYGLNWSLELYQQANARLYRQGQKKNVIIHRLIAKGTVDEEVIKRLESKDVTQDSLMESIKAKIEEYKVKNC